jgi:cobalt-zinc-cadmium efflux system membrane fusion protein
MKIKGDMVRAAQPPAGAGHRSQLVRLTALFVLLAALVAISAAAMPRVKAWLQSNGYQQPDVAGANESSAQIAPGDPNTILLPRDVAERLRVQVGEIRKATESRKLELPGSLAPDTDYLVPVRSRFPGEVVELGRLPDRELPTPTRFEPVRNGIHVHEGDLLAVVWSKDLGEKKNELIDAVLKRRVDQKVLQNYEELYRKGSIPERSLRDAQFNVQTDQNAVRKAESTLRAWRLTDEEIKAIYADADRLAERIDKGEPVRSQDQWRNWARVEVRAPFDGIILEKNITKGTIVDSTTNLFMIGDLSHLSAWAYVYEEDLPALLALARPIPWTIYIKNDPKAKPLPGAIKEIRPIIDPNVHAALVKGQVENPDSRLLSGQFISAIVDIPSRPNELTIPTSALVEDGEEKVIFLQPDSGEPRYTLRHVQVLSRGRNWVHIDSKVPVQDRARNLRPFRAGESVVTAGALEMWAALKDLQDRRKNTATR